MWHQGRKLEDKISKPAHINREPVLPIRPSEGGFSSLSHVRRLKSQINGPPERSQTTPVTSRAGLVSGWMENFAIGCKVLAVRSALFSTNQYRDALLTAVWGGAMLSSHFIGPLIARFN